MVQTFFEWHINIIISEENIIKGTIELISSVVKTFLRDRFLFFSTDLLG